MTVKSTAYRLWTVNEEVGCVRPFQGAFKSGKAVEINTR